MCEVRSVNAICWLLVILSNTILVVADLGTSSVPADVFLGSHLL